MLYKIILLVLFIKKYVCLNFDTAFPIVYQNPVKDETNYFGYTIAAFAGNKSNTNKWVRVGAPKGKFQTKQTGAVFDCSTDKCIEMSQFGASLRNKTLFGAAMDVNSRNFAVCGFRYYESIEFNVEKFDYPVGVCFSMDPLENKNSTEIFRYEPLWTRQTKPDRFLEVNGYHLYYGMGMAGFSLHLPEGRDELLLGAPGVYNWIGTPLIARKSETITNRNTVPNVFDRDGTQTHGLFGYAVASGYFLGKTNNLMYVAGRPRGFQYVGEAEFFKFKSNYFLINKIWSVHGEQTGEYFGSSLAAGDINGDSYDDIIIGAPYFNSKDYNEGRIYVYLGGQSEMNKTSVINGTERKGQFGTSLIILDDINGDGYRDAAISAPYENDYSGVVYIFKGTSLGLESQYSQRIQGTALIPNILGFGISISRPTDMDDNDNKDLAIGAFISGHGVLLRSRPVVIVKAEHGVMPNPILITENRKVVIMVCFTISTRGLVEFSMESKLTIDPTRAKYLTNDTAVINFHFENYNETCLAYMIELLDFIDISYPISIQADYRLLDKNMTNTSNGNSFCKICPIIETQLSTKNPMALNVSFDRNCGKDGVCVADLIITNIRILNSRNGAFLLGSQDPLELEITIQNTGENAFNLDLEIEFPKEAKLIDVPQCIRLNSIKSSLSSARCKVKDPIVANNTETVTYQWNMTEVNSNYHSDYLEFSFEVKTTSKTVNQRVEKKKFNITLEQKGATIFGLPKLQMFEDPYVPITFIQIFKVQKLGVKSPEKVQILIKIPYKFMVSDSEKTFTKILNSTVKLGEMSSNCNVILPQAKPFRNKNILAQLLLDCDKDDVLCSSIECIVGPFEDTFKPAIVEVGLTFIVANISDFMGKIEEIHIVTQGQVAIEGLPAISQHENFTSFIKLDNLFQYVPPVKMKVQIWIILVGVIVGLLLLILIIFGLLKIGFFKRTKKTQLQNLLNEILEEYQITEEQEIDLQNEELESKGIDSPLEVTDDNTQQSS